MKQPYLSRRNLLQWAGASAAGTIASRLIGAEPAVASAGGSVGVKQIDRSIVIPGRGKGPIWFHPRATVIPGEKTTVFMTLQRFFHPASDVFGPVHEAQTTDMGKTWTEPRAIPGLGLRPGPDGSQ